MSRGTLDPAQSALLSLTGLSPSPAGFPKTVLLTSLNQLNAVRTPDARTPVWALPLSLAATYGNRCFLSLPPGT